MLLSKVRAQYEQKSKIAGKYLAKSGLSPDGFTIIGTCLGFITGVLLWKSHFFLAALFMLFSGQSRIMLSNV